MRGTMIVGAEAEAMLAEAMLANRGKIAPQWRSAFDRGEWAWQVGNVIFARFEEITSEYETWVVVAERYESEAEAEAQMLKDLSKD